MGPRREITFLMFGDGIFFQDGNAWKQSRQLLRPQFHFKQYSDLDMFRDATNNLLDAIPRGGGVIDLQPLFFRLTLDLTAEFLFRKSIESLKVPRCVQESTRLCRPNHCPQPLRELSRWSRKICFFTCYGREYTR